MPGDITSLALRKVAARKMYGRDTEFVGNVGMRARSLGLQDGAISTDICSYGNDEGCVGLHVLVGNSAGNLCISHCL